MAHGETSPCIPKTGIKPFNGHLFRTCYILYIIYGCRTLYLLSKACFAICVYLMSTVCPFHVFLMSILCLPYVSLHCVYLVSSLSYAHRMSYVSLSSICLSRFPYVYLMCTLCSSHVLFMCNVYLMSFKSSLCLPYVFLVSFLCVHFAYLMTHLVRGIKS